MKGNDPRSNSLDPTASQDSPRLLAGTHPSSLPAGFVGNPSLLPPSPLVIFIGIRSFTIGVNAPGNAPLMKLRCLYRTFPRRSYLRRLLIHRVRDTEIMLMRRESRRRPALERAHESLMNLINLRIG